MKGHKDISEWLLQVQQLQVQNVHLKTQLADKIKSELSPGVLEQAEYFQNQFLNNDVAISLLRQEVVRNSSLQLHDNECNDRISGSRPDREKLNKDIRNMALGMERLRQEFYEYLHGNPVS